MSSLLNTLNAEKQEYYRLKEAMQQAASYLRKSYISLEKPANLEDCYSIDETSFDNYNIKNNRDKIQNKISFLTGPASTSIDSEISRLNSEIKAEEARIEEEKKKKAEEEKKKNEASSTSNSSSEENSI